MSPCFPRVVVLLVAALALSFGESASGGQSEPVPPDFLIKLERTSCFGTCPVYIVTIDAAGVVTYDGTDFVRLKGRQTARIPQANVAALLATVERIGFFDLRDRYRAIEITDLPTTLVTIRRGGRIKSVEHYTGAPAGLMELEAAIDKGAGTKRWVRIDEDTLRQMRGQGWVPSAAERADLFGDALSGDDVEVVKELLQLGADPNDLDGTGLPPLLVMRSAAAARVLLEAGANPSVTHAGRTPLEWAAGALAPEVTEVLLEAGAQVDRVGERGGPTPLFSAACSGNVGAVRLLLDAGADPVAARMWRPTAYFATENYTAIDCIREMREISHRVPEESPPFGVDFDAVTELLERALARRQPRQ